MSKLFGLFQKNKLFQYIKKYVESMLLMVNLQQNVFLFSEDCLTSDPEVLSGRTSADNNETLPKKSLSIWFWWQTILTLIYTISSKLVHSATLYIVLFSTVMSLNYSPTLECPYTFIYSKFMIFFSHHPVSALFLQYYLTVQLENIVKNFDVRDLSIYTF